MAVAVDFPPSQRQGDTAWGLGWEGGSWRVGREGWRTGERSERAAVERWCSGVVAAAVGVAAEREEEFAVAVKMAASFAGCGVEQGRGKAGPQRPRSADRQLRQDCSAAWRLGWEGHSTGAASVAEVCPVERWAGLVAIGREHTRYVYRVHA